MNTWESAGSGLLFILLGISFMLVAGELRKVIGRINERHFGGRNVAPLGAWGLRVFGFIVIAIGAALVASAITSNATN